MIPLLGLTLTIAVSVLALLVTQSWPLMLTMGIAGGYVTGLVGRFHG